MALTRCNQEPGPLAGLGFPGLSRIVPAHPTGFLPCAKHPTNSHFAYGSNMNPARMQTRGLTVLEALPGHLPGYSLCFNKRAADRAPGRAYANIRHQRDSV